MNQSIPQTPEITIAIVSYNTCDPLRGCLKALEVRRDEGEAIFDVVVADNASTDGSVAMVRTEFPWVRVVEAGGNLGYGRANNTALKDARSRYVFVLNSDTEVQPGALATMRDFMDAHPEIGAVGAQLILPDGAIQASCARDPSLTAVFFEQTYLYKLFRSHKVMGAYTMTDWTYDETRSVEQVCGACLFVRLTAWRQIGGFDPAYFMYFEDTDFCVRLRQAGWQIFFLPQARINHLLGASSRDWQTRARMIASYNKSRYYFFTRYGGRFYGRLLKALTLLGAGLRLVSWMALARRPAADEQVQIFRTVWRQTRAMRPYGEPSPLEKSARP